VRLLGNFEDSEDTRAIGSIFLDHLQFLTVERCTPCLFLEKLALPRDARIFIRYNLISHLIPFAFNLPQSIGEYVSLQGLASLHALITLQHDTYIDATGPNGSIAIRFTDLQDASPVCGAILSLPTTGITQFICEFHPASTMVEMGKVTKMMDILPRLEEIVLVHFSETATKNLLSPLKDASGWTNLLRLKLVHCRKIPDWIGDLVQVAAERKDEGLMLDNVTVVYGEEEQAQELFDVLKWFVGMVDLVEVRPGEVVRSEQVWDDISCTARMIHVSAWGN